MRNGERRAGPSIGKGCQSALEPSASDADDRAMLGADGTYAAATLERARAGDRDALAALWRAHNPALVRYLRGRGLGNDADDVAAQVWLEVASALGRFRGTANELAPWLYTIARRRAI